MFQSKDASVDTSFPVIKDQTQFSVAHARSSKVVKQNHFGINIHAFPMMYNVAMNLFFIKFSWIAWELLEWNLYQEIKINFQKPEECICYRSGFR